MLADPRFDLFLELLSEKNRHINLTATASLEELRIRHLEDSLQLLHIPELDRVTTLLDLGTGGGMPGIPLALARENLHVTLLDATLKKVNVVSEFIEVLGLKNATAVHGRAEELALLPAWRHRFEMVTARAVSRLEKLLPLALPLVKPGGTIVAFKGPSFQQEIDAASHLLKRHRISLVRQHPYVIRDARFVLLVFQVPGSTRDRNGGSGRV